MKRNSFFVILMASILGISASPALADAASDRADSVKVIQANFVNTLDDQHKTLLALKEQMKMEPKLLKQVNSVIADFDSNYSAIVNGLANVNQEIQPIEDLAKEDTAAMSIIPPEELNIETQPFTEEEIKALDEPTILTLGVDVVERPGDYVTPPEDKIGRAHV